MRLLFVFFCIALVISAVNSDDVKKSKDDVKKSKDDGEKPKDDVKKHNDDVKKSKDDGEKPKDDVKKHNDDVKKPKKTTSTVTIEGEPTVEKSERTYQDGDKQVVETTVITTKPSVTITEESKELPNSRLIVRPESTSATDTKTEKSKTKETETKRTAVAPRTTRRQPLMPPRKSSCLMHCPLFVQHVCTVRYYKGRLEFYSFLSNCNMDLFNCVNPSKKYFKFTNEDISCEKLNIPVLRA